MKNISRFIVGLVLISASCLISQTAYADADRDATPEEKAKVVETLKQNDCPVVEDVDYIQGIGFEADVKCNDGKEYDIFLDDNFSITSKREDLD
ncbi:MAG: hypothetical protein HC764_12080 [Pleurocapsa sp. CRU_1_2]|nr:hypothetical protein [Pleurocapsa sp. CRU_1_2]